jgi:hypothetical protein
MLFILIDIPLQTASFASYHGAWFVIDWDSAAPMRLV